MPLEQFLDDYVLLAHSKQTWQVGILRKQFSDKKLSTLRPLEPNVQPRFYRFSSVNEREHIRDQSMLCLVHISCFPQ